MKNSEGIKTVKKRALSKSDLGLNECHGCGSDSDHGVFGQKPVCKLFESEAFQEICGETLHPGGLELTEKGVSLCGFQKGMKILDIGCGKGETVNFLSQKFGLDAVGIDQSDLLIAEAQKAYPKLTFKKGDADFLEFPSCSFDGVVMECVLSLCDNREETLHEIWCILNNGGKLILSDLYLRSPEKQEKKITQDDEPQVKTCLTGALNSEELRALMAETGFKEIEWIDCSQTIGSITARAIMEYGSLEKFWNEVLPAEVDKNAFSASVMSGKPGYFLLVAEKAQK